MQLNKLHTAFILMLCMLLTACRDNDDVLVDPSTGSGSDYGKTPIELTVGGVLSNQGVATRAIVTDGTTNTDFGRDTKVFILMKSEVEYDDTNKKIVEHDGMEFKGNRAKTLYTVSRGDVVYNTDHTKLIFDAVNQKYWDDAHARSSQLTMWAIAQKVAEAKDGNWKNITFQQSNGSKDNPGISDASDAGYNTTTRNEWQGTTEVYPAIFSWSVGNMSNAHQNQDDKTIIYQDLLFSNNIANYVGYNKVPEASKTDNRLKFDFTTRKFPASPEMKFYHAMSKITIKIKAGDGFKVDGTDFELGNSTCIDKLCGFNTRGLFYIKDGEFQMIHDHADITKIPCTTNGHTSNDPYYTLEFLAIPNIHEFMKTQKDNNDNALSDIYSRFVKDKKDLTNDVDVMMQFTIDNNTYKITSDALFDALMQHNSDGTQKNDPVTGATKKVGSDSDASMGTYIPLEAGKNYVFTFNVSKTKISGITAKVVDWEEVTAEEINPSNARVTLSLDGRGTAKGSDVAFYRALNESSTIDDTYTSYDWAKTYEKSTSAEYQTSQWKTEWYWPNNKSFYHFRAISPANTTATTPDDADNYFELSSSSATLDGDGNPVYNEIAWGAPFVSGNTTFSYSTTKGFDGTGAEAAEEASRTHQIHKAIGPTDSQIKLLMFHMMSGVHFTIITETADGATNKVELCHNNGDNPVTYTHPTVQLVGYYPSGKVYMGDGHVDPDGAKTTTSNPAGITCRTTATTQYGQQDYYYSAVPQALTGANATDPGVQLYITTPDHNQYIVNLKDVLATSVSNNNITNPYTADGAKWKIDRWYPGFQYNYTLKLTKKGIEDITATIVNWETVEATYDDVQIQ